MLTPEQEKWVSTLSNSDEIRIFPFDPTAEDKFNIVKKLILAELGENITVEHRGATSLGISGQNEIDVYIPVSGEDFISLRVPLESIFGKPGSIHTNRVRYRTYVDKKRIDVFLVKEDSLDWKNLNDFETYLSSHSDTLEDYRLLKEQGKGLSTQEYYRQKIHFLNSILSKVNKTR